MKWRAELTRLDTGRAFALDRFDYPEAAKRWVKSHQDGVRSGTLPELAARIYQPDGKLYQETAVRRGGSQRLRWRWASLGGAG